MRNPIDCGAKLRLREKYRNMNQLNDDKGHTLFSRRLFVQGIVSAGALAAFGGTNRFRSSNADTSDFKALICQGCMLALCADALRRWS